MNDADRAAMHAIFNPGSVAVIGASDSPAKLGFHAMKSLTEGGYPGRIYPVNPGRGQIMGINSYPSIVGVPESVDLAIIVVPAERVPGTIAECKQKKIKGVVLISAGFREIEDPEGERLQLWRTGRSI
jgi:acetate---CoA ligase (ADP-forming)